MIKTPPKRNKQQIVLLALAAAAIGVILFFITGGIDTVKQVYGGSKIRGLHASEFKKLESPLKQLGFNDTAAPDSVCTRTKILDGKDTHLLCETMGKQYVVIGDDTAKVNSYVTAAKELDSLLKENSWLTSSNSAQNFEEWMKSVTSGADHNTDINARKATKSGTCNLNMTVAFSKPAPVAINTLLTCTSPDSN